jgi:SOS-response transcriptional repressor LexA
MDVFARRRARLQLLVDQLANGNISEFAKKFGYSRAQVSQFLSEKYNEGRSIGERAARTIELNVGKNIGWLDEAVNSVSSLVTEQKRDTKFFKEVVEVIDGLEPDKKRYNTPVFGTVAPDKDGTLGEVFGGTEQSLPILLFYTLSIHAYALQVKGAELQPRIRSGDYLLLGGEQKAEPGDDSLVKFTDGSWMILQYLYARNDEVVFGNVNGTGSNAVVPDYDIVSMTPILATLSGRLEIVSVRPKENS